MQGIVSYTRLFKDGEAITYTTGYTCLSTACYSLTETFDAIANVMDAERVTFCMSQKGKEKAIYRGFFRASPSKFGYRYRSSVVLHHFAEVSVGIAPS
jgi:hypothetical protein